MVFTKVYKDEMYTSGYYSILKCDNYLRFIKDQSEYVFYCYYKDKFIASCNNLDDAKSFCKTYI